MNSDSEVPRYKATRDILPATKARFRSEPPFATMYSSDEWQYGEKPIASGEEIETKSWPHPSFRALNYSAGRVLDFFNSRTRSRMPLSPWRNGRVELDDGLGGSGPIRPLMPSEGGAAAALRTPARAVTA